MTLHTAKASKSRRGFATRATETTIDATFYGQTPCASVLKSEHNLGLDDSNVCAIPKKASNACGLSVGTPLIVNQNVLERLAGLLNFNFGCGHSGMPIVFSCMAGRQFNWVSVATQQPYEPAWPESQQTSMWN